MATTWVIMGDFNALMDIEDRVGAPVRLSNIQDMRNCMAFCNLTKVKTVGRQYTWTNKQEGNARVFSRIDRVLANSAWEDLFPVVEATFLSGGSFDRCPMILSSYTSSNQKRPFRFYNMWTKSANFIPIVASNWEKVVHGCPMFQVTQKLKMIKHDMRELNKMGFCSIEAGSIRLHNVIFTGSGGYAQSPWGCALS